MSDRDQADPCEVCSRRGKGEGMLICERCRLVLVDMLRLDNPGDRGTNRPASIPVLFIKLDTRPMATGQQRRGPGFGFRSPASEHVITMRDRRSKCRTVAKDTTVYIWDPQAEEYVAKRYAWYAHDGKAHFEQDTPPRSIEEAVESVVRLVREQRGFTAGFPKGLPDQCRWLLGQVDWIARNDVGVFAYLRELQADLRNATGDPAPRPVGFCIEQLADGECEFPLFMPPSSPRAPDEAIADLPELRCGGCGARYDGRRLVTVRLVMEARLRAEKEAKRQAREQRDTAA